MEHKTALKRLNLLKGHVNSSIDARREASTATFDLAHAQEVLWSILPEGYFDALECASELHGLQDPSLHFDDRDKLRENSYDYLFGLINKMFEKGYTSPEKIAENIDHFCFTINSPGFFDLHASTRFMSHTALYSKTIKNLGTERHHDILMESLAFKTIGCFCLTELGHGSNAKGLETTATYDKNAQEFVINSPTQTSMKFWIGNLGKTAHNAVVLAQLLIEKNGKLVNKGVHCFEFQIRDEQTHIPLPGIEIGDCGMKKGLDGIDNGWMKFNEYRIPREALLNRFGDVTPEGEYKTDIPSDGKRFATSMSALSGGRISVLASTSGLSLWACTVALRFSAVRQQFGPAENETRILDYPLQQHRLIPKFAQSLIFMTGANKVMDLFLKNSSKLFEPGNIQTDVLHSLSSNMKSFITLKSQETIADCRRACGGHGFSFYSLFENMLQYNDIHCTWEGDNHVLRMQTMNFMLKMMKLASQGKSLPQTLEYLALGQFDRPKFSGSVSNTDDLLLMMREVACYQAIKAATKLSSCGLPIIEAFEKYQHFELKQMCETYNDTFLHDNFNELLAKFSCEKTKAVFEKLFLLSMTLTIYENPSVYMLVLGEDNFDKIDENIQDLCAQLRPEIIELTKVLPIPNRANGALGNEDLQVYKRLVQHFTVTEGVTERSNWWKKMYQNR
ncbi:unnamed protein product [Moneuplotes crassus]|uniref:Acyl-coenzyme A oxidase n=1 Tax=Euplotes crassus TaxID=5936 RepID=A0AAD1X4T5_EUPCR|nr:unnamed protein product [Moneuplotes crassus]